MSKWTQHRVGVISGKDKESIDEESEMGRGAERTGGDGPSRTCRRQWSLGLSSWAVAAAAAFALSPRPLPLAAQPPRATAALNLSPFSISSTHIRVSRRGTVRSRTHGRAKWQPFVYDDESYSIFHNAQTFASRVLLRSILISSNLRIQIKYI